ncbi:MAG: peroxidase [Kofleriaceae bacterium]
MAAPGLNLADVQGLVYTGYKKLPYAGFLFACFGTDEVASRAWLQAMPIGSAAHEVVSKHSPKVQVAFSATGLRRLGVPEAVLDGLPNELKLGMANRWRVLGDTPAEWTLGQQPLDVIVMIYATSEAERAALLVDHRELLEVAGATVHPDEVACKYTDREHFGFTDGLSQPFIPGLHGSPRPHERQIALGELLLGYPNAYDKLPVGPRYPDFDLGANGTYVVFRKLAQDVGALWTYLEAQAPRLDMDAEMLAAKLLGRWRDGRPLVLAPNPGDKLHPKQDLNDFNFLKDDPDGLKCPIAAHIRRANPRDARDGTAKVSLGVVDRHRILRRGRSYGAPIDIADAKAGRDDKQPRGLYFIGIGASIARGFEFIQQTWLNNPSFHGLQGENDPVIGRGGCPFTIPADPVRKRLLNMPQIVKTLGGGYFFMPSLAAIRKITAA